MKYTNYKKLEKVIFRYPDLMEKNAEDKVKALFKDMEHTRELLADANSVADEYRKHLTDLEKQWQAISNMADFVYKTEDREDNTNEVNIGFNFSADINKNIH